MVYSSRGSGLFRTNSTWKVLFGATLMFGTRLGSVQRCTVLRYLVSRRSVSVELCRRGSYVVPTSWFRIRVSVQRWFDIGILFTHRTVAG